MAECEPGLGLVLMVEMSLALIIGLSSPQSNTGVELVQFSVYNASDRGFYDWHMDVT